MHRFGTFAITTSMAAGLILSGPVTAYAAGTPATLTATQMVAALNAAADTTGTAAAGGWRAADTMGYMGLSRTGLIVVDPVHGVAMEQESTGGYIADTLFTVDHQGTYDRLTGSAERGAVRMMKRPAVRYSFQADRALRLADYLTDSGGSPVSLLTTDTNHAGTQTVNDDGSTDYAYTDRGSDAVTLTVDASGILTRAAVTTDDITFAITYAYGAQHVGLPTPATTISTRDLRRGVAYFDMKANVKEAADETARNIRNAANGAIVTVASLRQEARDSADLQNEFTTPHLVKVTNVSGGVKVHATNPWTHKTVAYTVKASGRLVVVRKA